jgi:effector-associated domain 2 (EAD2)-containing protein
MATRLDASHCGLNACENGQVLVEAFVGWVVEVIGSQLLAGARAGVLGTPDRRALARAVGAAAEAVLAELPASAREPVAAALGERFASPPALAIDARTPVREALVAGVRLQIAPLADRGLTGTGRSFLEEIGVDPARLQDDLPQAVIRAVEQVATGRPALAPLAAQLNADALLAEVRALRHEPAGGIPQPGVFALVDALLAVETMADEGSRREVLRQLPPGLAGAIPHHAVPRVQVLAIVRTCLGYSGGLRQLLDVICLIEQDSQTMAQLEAAAARAFPELLS